jgi:hypothetical protein
MAKAGFSFEIKTSLDHLFYAGAETLNLSF